MATYKKRGYKPKNKEEEVEIIEENSTTAEVFNTLDEGASKTEEWVAENQKYILGGIGAIVLVVMAYLGYKNFVQEPNELKASNELFQAQQHYDEALKATGTAKDSLFTLALAGAEGKFGFEEIVNNYGGTKAGNLARYYAGFAHLNTGAYQKAIDQLDGFKSDDNVLKPAAFGGIGDAFVQLNQLEEGLSYYDKAIKASADNAYSTPRMLLKASLIAMEVGKADVAATYLERIEKEYSQYATANNIAAYLAKAQAM